MLQIYRFKVALSWVAIVILVCAALAVVGIQVDFLLSIIINTSFFIFLIWLIALVAQKHSYFKNQDQSAQDLNRAPEKFNIFKTSWFYLTLLLLVFCFLFGLSMNGGMPGEIVMAGAAILMICYLLTIFSSFKLIIYFSMKVVAFVGFAILNFALGYGFIFVGAYVQQIPHKIHLADSNKKLDQEYEVWKSKLEGNIFASYSTDIEKSVGHKNGIYKSVSDSKTIFNYLTEDDKLIPLNNTVGGTPVYTDFNNAISISSESNLEIFNYALGKKLLVTLKDAEGQRFAEGSFSDDSKYYQAKIEFTGSVGYDARSTRDLYIVLDMANETLKLTDMGEVTSSKKQTVSSRSVDVRNLDYDSCLKSMHGSSSLTEYFEKYFGYHYDYIYNTRSGGENAVTVSDETYYYFTALNSKADSAIFKMDKKSCAIENILTPEKQGLAAGKIRSVSFVGDKQIIFSINPNNSKNLLVFIYDLVGKNVGNVGKIENTEIFELVNNTFLQSPK